MSEIVRLPSSLSSAPPAALSGPPGRPSWLVRSWTSALPVRLPAPPAPVSAASGVPVLHCVMLASGAGRTGP
jgi:hypothetical protein